jgi:hypothetical protein
MMNQNEKRELKNKVREAIMKAVEAGVLDSFLVDEGLTVEDRALADAGVILGLSGEFVAIDAVVKSKSFDLEDSIEALADKERKEAERVAKKIAKLEKLKAKADREKVEAKAKAEKAKAKAEKESDEDSE